MPLKLVLLSTGTYAHSLSVTDSITIPCFESLAGSPIEVTLECESQSGYWEKKNDQCLANDKTRTPDTDHDRVGTKMTNSINEAETLVDEILSVRIIHV